MITEYGHWRRIQYKKTCESRVTMNMDTLRTPFSRPEWSRVPISEVIETRAIEPSWKKLDAKRMQNIVKEIPPDYWNAIKYIEIQLHSDSWWVNEGIKITSCEPQLTTIFTFFFY